ncbi:MAG TPA: PQQ-dependent sugar dehydrogenase [Planctomycetota bacterium]|nr:PQQ-dependent sugar dehydrogenase [Planctomycetota bacterium]
MTKCMTQCPRAALAGVALLSLLTGRVQAQGNQPPLAPIVTEPEIDGQVVSPSDVHMETGPFSDPDPGDAHACSDWEIYLPSSAERVWATHCIRGPEAVHTHLGDGVFEGSHAGRTTLLENTAYLLRVRHSDDSGDPQTQWSSWSMRSFVTGAASTIYPAEIQDVVEDPAFAWTYAADGFVVELPGAVPPPLLRVESSTGQLLLEIAGTNGPGNVVTNPAGLGGHVDVRIQVQAGASGLNLPETNLMVVDEHCNFHTILLPVLNLGAGQDAYYWVASSGATYVGNGSQTDPDFGNLARGLMWNLLQPGYQVEAFASGLQLPVNVAFVPDAGSDPGDPFLYVTELYGKIKVVTNDGTVSDYATNLLNYNPSGSFPGSGEQGLAGIAVDPETGDVFASMLYDSGGPHYPKVDRFSSSDGGMTAASQSTILAMPGESMGQAHQISHIEMLGDRTLLVHLGDGFDASAAQNLSSYRGKILRMTLDGSAPADNPYYDSSNGINATDYVYVYGVRNPFGGSFRAEDGFHYEVENGPSIDRFAKVVPGRNYLWNGSNSSMLNFALHVWSPAVAPVNIAFIQPETFGGSQFPSTKQGHAFVSESGPTYASGPQQNGKRLTEWVLDANGDLDLGPISFLEFTGGGHATCVGLAAGPDGLYFTDLYRDAGNSPTASGAHLWRVYFEAGFDCNQNGIHDACDISSGVSQDDDGDGVPDECECVSSNFCQSTPNSTGTRASISSNGQCSVSDNAFVLTAASVPDQPGVFFYGDGQAGGGAGVPFFDGFRCVGGTSLIRLGVTAGSGGQASYALDFTALPPAGQISPGSTWYFQFWFRDPAGSGTGVNLSDGLGVTFQ